MKALIKLQLWWIKNAYPEANLTESYLANLKVLKPKDFTKLDIRKSCIYPIKGIYPKLVNYIEVLKQLIYQLETEQAINISLINKPLQETNLDRFLLSSLNQYTHTDLLVEEYKANSQSYFTLYNSLKTNKPHLQRQLDNFNSHLNALTLSLIGFNTNVLSRKTKE